MNLLLTIDDNYCQHAAVVITSVCMHNTDCHFFIMSDYISEQNIKQLKMLVDSFQATMQLLWVENTILNSFPIGKGTANDYVTLATYYRLFISELLPLDIDKIIYLDCDVVVNCSLLNLWRVTLDKKHWVVALEEMDAISANAVKRLGYGTQYSYFNAGVMLLNVAQLREYRFTQKALEYVQQNRNRIKFHDQDVLNALLYDKKIFMPLKYNVMDTFLKEKACFPARYSDSISDLYNPVVIHFAGPIKPWFRECNHPYKCLYYYYLSKTPWADYSPRYKYKNLSSRLLYRLKCCVKKFLSTFTGLSERYKKEFYQVYTCRSLQNK